MIVIKQPVSVINSFRYALSSCLLIKTTRKYAIKHNVPTIVQIIPNEINIDSNITNGLSDYTGNKPHLCM